MREDWEKTLARILESEAETFAHLQKVLEEEREALEGLAQNLDPDLDQALANLNRGHIRSTGVGLREGEIQALAALGQALGKRLGTVPVARNALIRLAVRRMLADLRAGRVRLEDLAQHFVPSPPGLA